MQEFGELIITEFGKEKRIPTYTCGHCSAIVLMRPDRVRERKNCLQCGRYICEKSEICNTVCTPLPDLAKDNCEGPVAQKYGRYVPAIMKGITSIKEAEDKQLILTGDK